MFGSKTEVRNSCFKFKCCVLCLNERKDDGNEKREINHQKEDTSDGGGAEKQKEARVERVGTGAGGQGKEEEDGGRKFINVIIMVKIGNHGYILRILSLNVILKFVFYESLTFSDFF